MTDLLRIYPGQDYPDAWRTGQIQTEVHNLAGWVCEHCGMIFPRGDTRAIEARNRLGNPIILTVHHINGQPNDCRWENLLSCCQICHLHIQAVWAPGDTLPLQWRNEPPRWLLDRKLDYKFNPQMALIF